MNARHELCRKVFSHTGNRDIAIRAIRECFGLAPHEAETVMRAVECGFSRGEHKPLVGESDGPSSTLVAGRVGIWCVHGTLGLFASIGSSAFLTLAFAHVLPASENTFLLVAYCAVLTSGLIGGTLMFAIEGVRPASIGRWGIGVMLISAVCLALAIATFPAVAAVYSMLRYFNLAGPPPESSDSTGVLETLVLITVFVAAAAPLSGELASRMRLPDRRDP